MIRLIGKVLIENGNVLNSYTYNGRRPCGSAYHAIKRLQEWQIDEILILNRSHGVELSRTWEKFFEGHGLGILNTPIAYGGGLDFADKTEIQSLAKLGIERFVVRFKTFASFDSIGKVSKVTGENSGILHVPFVKNGNDFYAFNGSPSFKLSSVATRLQGWGGEVVLTDVENEGSRFGVSSNLIDASRIFTGINVAISGGIAASNDISSVIDGNPEVGGIVLGNVLNRRELVLEDIRMEKSLIGKIRKPQPS